MVDSGDFKDGMRHLVGAVTLITTLHESQRRGLTATAVCSLTAEPPSLLVCVNRNAEAHDLIAAAGCFCVNVLGYQHQDLAESFAARDGSKGEARFARGSWSRLVTGAPHLVDSLAAFDCEVFDAHAFATHTMYLGRVVAVQAGNGAPLLYAHGRFGRLHPLSGPLAEYTEAFRGEHNDPATP